MRRLQVQDLAPHRFPWLSLHVLSALGSQRYRHLETRCSGGPWGPEGVIVSHGREKGDLTSPHNRFADLRRLPSADAAARVAVLRFLALHALFDVKTGGGSKVNLHELVYMVQSMLYNPTHVTT